MTRWDEEQLERACAQGDVAAIDAAFELLDAAQAYTRARASEILCLAPERILLPRLRTALEAGSATALHWRIIALFGSEHGRAPGGAELVTAMERALESVRYTADADMVFHIVGALAETRIPRAGELAATWTTHADEEVALAAASLVAKERTLFRQEIERLARFESPCKYEAMMLRVEQGDRAAVEPLARSIVEMGPLAFAALDVLERHGRHEALAPLRALWKRRFGVGHVGARAAGAAVVIGDAEALVRLRQLARSFRRTTRAVALSELARVGGPDDFRQVRARVEGGTAEAAHIVGELWRRGDSLAHELIAQCLQHRLAEVRLAAVEAAGQLEAPSNLREALMERLHDSAPEVVEAAQVALEQLAKRNHATA